MTKQFPQSFRFRGIAFWTALLVSITIVQGQTVLLREQQSAPFRLSDTNDARQLINTAGNLMDTKTDSALFLLHKAKSWSELNGYNNGIVNALLRMVTAYAIKNDIPKAREVLDKAKKYCFLSPDRNRLTILWYQSQFIMYKYAGKSDSALLSLKNAQPLLEKVKDPELTVNIYNHIGAVLIDNQDYNSAYPYIVKAKALNPYENTELLVSHINLAYISDYQGDLKSMYQNAREALMLSQKLNAPKYNRSASVLLTKYYLAQGDEKKAAAFADNAIGLMDKYVTDNHLYVYRLLSNIYASRGYIGKALDYGERAVKVLGPGQKGRRDAIFLYAQMARLHHDIGNDAKAYHYLVAYMEAVDSVTVQERNLAIDHTERQFRLSEKEKEIVQKENILLQQKNQLRKRDIWIIVIASGLLIGCSVAGLLYSLYRSSRRKIYILHQQKEIDELKAMINGEEKERNRIAIELHDNIGGMLSAAAYTLDSMQNKDNNPEQHNAFNKISNIVTEVRNEIRKTAHILMPDVLLRHSLPEALLQHCHFIERDTGIQINLLNRGEFEHLHKDVQLMLYRIAQELIQNVLKHARATQIMVQLHSGKGLTSLTVEDNGTGFNRQIATEGRGLQNIRSRLMIVDGKISIDTGEGKGSSIYIEISTSDPE